MFRASARLSLGAYNCTRSLWFYHWIEVARALLVVVWQVELFQLYDDARTCERQMNKVNIEY
jgi:hypothetical protein